MKIQRTLRKIGKTIDWFIPPHIQAQYVLHRRARLLMWVHLFILVFCLLMFPSSIFIENASYFPIFFALLALIISMLVFRKWGNISLSSNILTSVPAFTLIPLIFSTGGMYSGNLLWLYLCPFIAFLFTDKFSRMFWAVVVVGFHCYLFKLELKEGTFITDIPQGAVYYFTSYLFLFLMMLGIVYIFKLEQDFVIKQLRKHKNKLTRQKEAIQEQADQLRQQEQELKEVNKDLEQFAYVASHDLKEPLRTIGSFTQLIEQELKGKANESTDEYIHFVQDGVERMKSLITNLLSDIKYKSKEPTAVNLNDVIIMVINNLSASVKECNASINYDELPTVKGNSIAYVQLFQNLISNSLKFQQVGVPPNIRIIHSGISGHHQIKVSDNGMGISKEHLPNIFEFGNQGETEQSYRGQGIGLATCKKIVHRFGGDISVASEVDKGTVFTIQLPIV